MRRSTKRPTSGSVSVRGAVHDVAVHELVDPVAVRGHGPGFDDAVPALVDEVGDPAFEQTRVERLAESLADELQPERLSQTL